MLAITKAFRLLAGSAARACAVSTKLLSRRCAQVFRSLQIQSLQIQSLQPPVQLAGTWSLNVTGGPVGTRYCSFEGELRHSAAYKADDRLAALQVPHAVLAMIVEALRPADRPAFRLVCSAWHQLLEIQHEVRLISGWPELNENRISTIRQLLPKATVNIITAGRSEDELQHVNMVTVQKRLDLYARKPSLPQLGQLQTLVSRAGHRLELHINLTYQDCLPSATISAFREVAKAITVLLVGDSELNALTLDMVPLTGLTYLSFNMPDSDAEGHQTVRAVQGLQHLRGIGVTFENANQVPALLECLAGLGQLTELYIGGTETEVCLNLSSLKDIMSLHMGDGIEFSHPPPKLTHYTIDGIPTSRMMSQLSELHNLTDVTLEGNCGYEHLPTTLQKLSVHELWDVSQGQLSAVLGSLTQLRTLRIAAFLTVELIHMLASLHFPHLQTFGFDLPNFTAADIEHFAVASRADTDRDCISVHVHFVVEMLSTFLFWKSLRLGLVVLAIKPASYCICLIVPG